MRYKINHACVIKCAKMAESLIFKARVLEFVRTKLYKTLVVFSTYSILLSHTNLRLLFSDPFLCAKHFNSDF